MAAPEKVESALIAYNAVWQGWSGIDAHNVEVVRLVAMTAALNAVITSKNMDPEKHAFEAVFRAYQAMAAGFDPGCKDVFDRVPRAELRAAVDPECRSIFERVFANEMPALDGIPVLSRYVNKVHAKGSK